MKKECIYFCYVCVAIMRKQIPDINQGVTEIRHQGNVYIFFKKLRSDLSTQSRLKFNCFCCYLFISQTSLRLSLILYVSLPSLLVKMFFSFKKFQTLQRFCPGFKSLALLTPLRLRALTSTFDITNDLGFKQLTLGTPHNPTLLPCQKKRFEIHRLGRWLEGQRAFCLESKS